MNARTWAGGARPADWSLAPEVWDFIEDGAGEERAAAANREAFDQVWLRPSVFRGSGGPDPRTTILGHTWAAPLGVVPLAYLTLAEIDEGTARLARFVEAAAG